MIRVDIKGYEGLYRIDSSGNIFNKHGNKLKNWLDKKNTYYRVTLCNNTKRNNYLLHRLLAIAFIPNPLNLTEACHIDNNKKNNNLNNLEWGSKSYNSQCAYDTGIHLKMIGVNCPAHKLTEKEVLEIRAKYIPWKYSSRKLGLEYNIHQSVILDIVKNNNWKHI